MLKQKNGKSPMETGKKSLNAKNESAKVQQWQLNLDANPLDWNKLLREHQLKAERYRKALIDVYEILKTDSPKRSVVNGVIEKALNITDPKLTMEGING